MDMIIGCELEIWERDTIFLKWDSKLLICTQDELIAEQLLFAIGESLELMHIYLRT